MAAPPLPASQRPHPVVFDVEYPDRLSRWKIFVKWLLALPHFIVVYLLLLVLYIITFFAWFAILFTGRYPKTVFDLSTGIHRWSSNVVAYFALMRDEYPPFSLEAGEYALLLDIPRAERQSRFRLFIRFFAAIPSYIVFGFLQIAWYVTTFIAWWAILFTGRYPRGLFRFNTGVMRWYNRMSAYFFCLRDEYPPYSINANARPGNEVVSAIIGVPLGVAYIGFYVFFSFAPLLGGGETIEVRAPLDGSGSIAREQPTGEAGGLRITLLDFDPDAPVDNGFNNGFSFDVRAEKDGWFPTYYVPYLFSVEYCDAAFVFDDGRYGVTEVDGDQFAVFVFSGSATSQIAFQGAPEQVCALEYFTTGGAIRFEFN